MTLITAIQRILANSDSIVSMWIRLHVRTACGPKQRKGYLPVTPRLRVCPASRSTARLMTNGQTYANLQKTLADDDRLPGITEPGTIPRWLMS